MAVETCGKFYHLIVFEICHCLLQIFVACGWGFFSTNNAIQCMVAFIEWFYQASLPKHTEGTLKLMADAFQKFNNLKDVFINVSPSSFKFPKMHMLTHFMHFIRHYGTLDNMDTEYTEHAHIPFAKVPYRCSNKRDPLPQMIQQVVRQEAIEQKMAILESKSNAQGQTKSDWELHAIDPELQDQGRAFAT